MLGGLCMLTAAALVGIVQDFGDLEAEAGEVDRKAGMQIPESVQAMPSTGS